MSKNQVTYVASAGSKVVHIVEPEPKSNTWSIVCGNHKVTIDIRSHAHLMSDIKPGYGYRVCQNCERVKKLRKKHKSSKIRNFFRRE